MKEEEAKVAAKCLELIGSVTKTRTEIIGFLELMKFTLLIQGNERLTKVALGEK